MCKTVGRLCVAAFSVLAFPALLRGVEFEPYTSGVMRGGERAEQIRLRVAGLKQLVLIAAPIPDFQSAHADWGDARLIAADGRATYLSDLKPVQVEQPYGTLRLDKSHRGGPITIASQTFRRGLGTHAPSQIAFNLDGKYEWLEAWIGIDVTAGQAGSVQFRVADRLCGSIALPSGKRDFRTITAESLRLAIQDLIETFGPRYPKGKEYLARLEKEKGSELFFVPHDRKHAGIVENSSDPFYSLAREALLANPLLGFDRMLVVKRRPLQGGKPVNPDTSFGADMGLPRSSMGNSTLAKNAFDNEIAVLPMRGGTVGLSNRASAAAAAQAGSATRTDGRLTTLYRPKTNEFVGDMDLHFDADRLLFSMRDERGCFQIYELQGQGGMASLASPWAPADMPTLREGMPPGTMPPGVRLRQVSRGDQPDVDNYDACYLPDGRIAFCSTACFQGVPCNATDVAVLYRMDADGGNVRQLCFEQDHDFNPVVMESGRVLYLRWEYSDLPHSNSRRMFTMNPDGTGQMAYYGSNSYWPNAIFGARPIPGHPGKFIGIVAGHHGSYREGELVLFDTGRGRQEAEGVVQRIPGRGRKVEPLVRDQLTAASWPKFAHPYPLSDKHFLVTCKLDATAPWDIYLVDVFDNMLRLGHADGYGLLEPIPLRKTPRPPVLPERIDPGRKDAVVYMADIYRGPGLAGVPRGTVKNLRLYTFHFAYRGMGGLLGTVGLDGPWDVRRVLGTVPVEPDGSAVFRIPANTPIGLQPLDAEGKAVQLMRSWLVGMPGETVSCVGCHESHSTTPVNLSSVAARRRPAEIAPWHGPPRNFSFKREVQPVLDRHCVGCHNGESAAEGGASPDLRGTLLTSNYKSNIAGNGNGYGGRYFSVGYFELSRFVRRPGIESDMHLLKPYEFHADTTELVRVLTKGHYGVRLDAEAWDRLITWIDMNAPYHGTWTEMGWNLGRQPQRRRQLRKLYAGVDEDPEGLAAVQPPSVAPAMPGPAPRGGTVGLSNRASQITAGQAGSATRPPRRTIDLGGGASMDLVLIPPGEFMMGDPQGEADEQPLTRVRIDRPFWMGACEVTNRQYARFDPQHDSRFESKNGYQFGVTGFDLSGPGQPVVRISWQEATAFCAWLSRRTGTRFALPSEAQWEYACRAGSEAAFSFGALESDFSPFANMADVRLQHFATDPYTVYEPLAEFTKYDDWIPRDARYNDQGLVTVEVGRYRPNAWGLYDVHGNVWEWTLSTYRPYPCDPQDGRDDGSPEGLKVVRGGSWRDRPKQCRSAVRWRYPAWQSVYNVGFRVACYFEADAR